MIVAILCMWTTSLASAAVTGGRAGGSFPRAGIAPPPIVRAGPSTTMGYGRPLSSSAYYRGRGAGTTLYYQLSHKNYYPLDEKVFALREQVVRDVATIGTSTGILYHSWLQDKKARAKLQGVQVLSLTIALKLSKKQKTQDVDWTHQLSCLAETADTTTPRGLQTWLEQVVQLLLQHQDSWYNAAINHNQFLPNESLGQQRFYALSTTERAKLDSEVINKFGADVDMRGVSTVSSGNIEATLDDDCSSHDSNKFGVVTLTVSLDTQGTENIPKTMIVDHADVRQVLNAMTTSSSSGNSHRRASKGNEESSSSLLLAGEVIWAPAATTSASTMMEEEFITEDFLYRNYPNLVPLL